MEVEYLKVSKEKEDDFPQILIVFDGFLKHFIEICKNIDFNEFIQKNDACIVFISHKSFKFNKKCAFKSF